MEQVVGGLETIPELSCNVPERIHVPFKLEYKQLSLQQGWNSCFIAIIPYCFKCKVPLVWHRYPDGEVLFHCPECGRRWVKGDDWNENHNENHKV